MDTHFREHKPDNLDDHFQLHMHKLVRPMDIRSREHKLDILDGQ